MSDVPTRLLRETLRRGTGSPSSGCIDAETLAVWSEGKLSAPARAAAESHASSCARCQALLAAMIRMTPVETAPRSWWRASTLGWLVPLAAAAAAVLLWITVPADQGTRSAAMQPAQATTPVVTQSPAASPDAGAESKPAGRASDAAVSPRTVAPRRAAREGDEQRGRTSMEAAARLRTESSAQANAAPPAEPMRLPQASATAERAMTDRTMSLAAAPLLAKAAAVPTVIVSPDVNVRWRIAAGGVVDRTTNGGISWETQSTGVSSTLTAGAAPSPTVCWLVGPGGLVMLSTDGSTWQRMSFPEAVDLTSIRASDATNAIVTAADGRTFATTDGGKTWRPL